MRTWPQENRRKVVLIACVILVAVVIASLTAVIVALLGKNLTDHDLLQMCAAFCLSTLAICNYVTNLIIIAIIAVISDYDDSFDERHVGSPALWISDVCQQDMKCAQNSIKTWESAAAVCNN